MESIKKSKNNYENLNSAGNRIQDNSRKEPINYELSKSEIDLLIKAGKRSSVICGQDWKSLINFSYRFVKETAPNGFEEQTIIELIKAGCEEKGFEFSEPDPKELIYFSLWLKDQLDIIHRKESQLLSKPPKPEMIAAGVDRFDKYGTLNVIYGICERFGWSMEQVWTMRYEDVFTLQLHAKDSGEFNEALNEIYKKKKK